jgi:uncharacterized protein YggL (DUF469 family)
MPQPKPHHKRRHRKKLHLGEFQQQGIAVSAGFPAGFDEARREQAMLALIGRIESLGLAYGGGDSASGMDGYVYALGGRSCAEPDRVAVRAALEDSGFVEINVGPLSDAWYDDEDDAE